jgi:hypothetical protein
MLALVVGRAVQEFGGGLMITAVWVGIGRGYPKRLRARMFTRRLDDPAAKERRVDRRRFSDVP